MFVKNGTAELKHVLTSPPDYLKKADPINEISKKYQFEPLNQAKLANEYQALIAAYKKADI
jgi:N-dimethylarginine dimethylaminohydrolase